MKIIVILLCFISTSVGSQDGVDLGGMFQESQFIGIITTTFGVNEKTSTF
tara:strand:+ start:2712 stop:2861 length:150 start_codon:yes stop_codon:yes gene_type:complete